MQHSWEEHDEDSKPKAKEKEKEKEKAMPRWGGASGSLDFRSSLRSRQLRRVTGDTSCCRVRRLLPDTSRQRTRRRTEPKIGRRRSMKIGRRMPKRHSEALLDTLWHAQTG